MSRCAFGTAVAARGTGDRIPRGLLVHTTGSGLVDKARKLALDPEEYAVSYYQTAAAYPHYLIAPDGDLYSFADDRRIAAHAAWRPWEKAAYLEVSWEVKWARDFLDDVRPVPLATFYQPWRNVWRDGGRYYASPAQIVEQIGGAGATPNRTFIGVEVIDCVPFTDAAHETIARLFVDCARRNEWFDPAQIDPNALPQPWLCSHSDVGPCRRWAKNGRPFDPGARINWGQLGGLIARESRL